MQIIVWSGFSKRINSTKQPTGGTTVDVFLKAETDIKNPSFILTSTDFTINYVMAFGNYYFCTPINIDASRLELKCTMDYMATFKAGVGAYRGLIDYAASSSNVFITDPRNTPTMEIASAFSMTDLSTRFDSDGVYILGVLGSQGGSTGMTTFYAMTRLSFMLFMTEAFSQNIIDDIINDFNGVQNCIISCFWLPLKASWIGSHFTGVDEAIQIGRCTGMTAHGYKLISRLYTETDNMGVPYPLAYPAKTYLHRAPYLTAVAYLPFVGTVNLDADLLADEEDVDVTFTIDILTGDVIYYFKYTGTGHIIATYSGNMASKIPVSGASYDGIGVATGALQIIGGVASGIVAGDVGTAIKGAVSGAQNISRSLSLHTQINGAVSSAAAADYAHATTLTLQCYVQEPAETNLLAFQAAHGMPYHKVATVSSLSGYVQCHDASVDIAGDGAEQDVVNGYMNSGFYYE